MKHLCTFILYCMTASVQGQEMTLQECISKGTANNLSLANARIDIAKGRTGVSQNRSRLLPVINGIAQLTDYLKRPVNVTTGTLLGNDFPAPPRGRPSGACSITQAPAYSCRCRSTTRLFLQPSTWRGQWRR